MVLCCLLSIKDQHPIYLVSSKEVQMCVDHIWSWCSLLLYSNVVHLTSLVMIDSVQYTFQRQFSLPFFLVLTCWCPLTQSLSWRCLCLVMNPFFIDWLEAAMWWVSDWVIFVQGFVHVIGNWDWWTVLYRYKQWWCYRDQYHYLIFLRIRTFSCTKSVIKRRKKEKYFS